MLTGPATRFTDGIAGDTDRLLFVRRLPLLPWLRTELRRVRRRFQVSELLRTRTRPDYFGNLPGAAFSRARAPRRMFSIE